MPGCEARTQRGNEKRKKCSGSCKLLLAHYKFGKLAAAKDGLQYECKECQSKERAKKKKTDGGMISSGILHQKWI